MLTNTLLFWSGTSQSLFPVPAELLFSWSDIKVSVPDALQEQFSKSAVVLVLSYLLCLSKIALLLLLLVLLSIN